MLRIAGKNAPPVKGAPTEVPVAPDAPEDVPSGVPEDMPEATDVAPDAPTDAPMDDTQHAPGGGLNQQVAGYKGPEQGPFMCGNCQYYASHGPNTCEIVDGQIDEMGVCNVFTPSAGHDGQDTGADTEAPPEEAPTVPEAPPTDEPAPTE